MARKKMTKQQAWDDFRENIMPYVLEREGGRPDDPMRHEAWTIYVDSKIREEVLPESAYNWDTPKGLYSQRTPLPKTANPYFTTWDEALDYAEQMLKESEGRGTVVVLEGPDDSFALYWAGSSTANRKVFGEHTEVIAHVYNQPRGRLRVKMDKSYAPGFDPGGVYLHEDIGKPWLTAGGRRAMLYNPEPETKKLKAKLLR